MGKYASRESTGVVVGWDDVTGKPTTFTPIVHGNAHHSTAYAPVADPAFTGRVKVGTIGASVPNIGGLEAETLLRCVSGNKTIYFYNTGAIIKLDAYDYGASAGLDIHIGGNGGNVIVANNLVAAKLQTANWSFEEDGNDLIIKRGSTVLARLSSTGYLHTKDEQESHDATP